MKALSRPIVLGLGFLLVSGSPARAQLGGMGEAVKKGAADAAKQEVMKGVAEKVGLPTPTAPVSTPTAGTGAVSTPVGEPKVTPGAAEAPAAAPAADTGAATAPVGEPKVAPGAAEAPAAMPGAAGTVEGAGEQMMKKKMPKLP